MTADNAASSDRRKQLQDAAWRLADEWHARKLPSVTVADLEKLCPGFTKAEYEKAINDALLWTSK